jgi:DNA end-binding protein Ku
MAPRASWKGFLKMSLVSCRVALYPAETDSERISFHLINRPTRHRVRQQLVDEKTGKAVDREDRIKGYEIDRGEYVELSDEELKGVEISSTHVIDIERFVKAEEVDAVYLDRTYYLAPDGKVAADAFATIRDAMKERRVVALGRVVMFKRERVVMLAPFDKGLTATLLHYNYEVRDEDEFFDSIPGKKTSGEMLDLAKHIIETKAGRFDPDTFKDRYQDAVMALIKAKQSGREPPKPPKGPPSNVINLLDALRRSAKGESRAAGEGKPAARSRRKTTAAARKRTGKRTIKRAGRARQRLKKAS